MFIFSLLQNPLLTIIYLGAIILSITIHEFAHAFVADRCGDDTARLEGRLSINPFAHLDPIGTILLLLVGFGWGKPVPINIRNFRNKGDETKVALAGIVANILLALVLALPIRLALLNGQLIESSLLLMTLNLVINLNINLAAFNILPIPPLDGSHLIESLLSAEARMTYAMIGPFVLLILLVSNFIPGLSLISIIIEPIVRALSFLIKGVPDIF